MKKVNLKDQIPPGFDLSCEPIILKNSFLIKRKLSGCKLILSKNNIFKAKMTQSYISTKAIRILNQNLVAILE